MVASLRHFLVVFLVLLQIAAPLVHAHVGSPDRDGGFHLHGFENVQLAIADNAFTAGELTISKHLLSNAPSMIVEVGSAIRLQQADDDYSPILYLLSEYAALVNSVAAGAIVFPYLLSTYLPSHFLGSHSSRAPPR